MFQILRFDRSNPSLYLVDFRCFIWNFNNLSPDVVEDQIKNILINKRKVELARNLEEDVYERAKRNNEFEVYN